MNKLLISKYSLENKGLQSGGSLEGRHRKYCKVFIKSLRFQQGKVYSLELVTSRITERLRGSSSRANTIIEQNSQEC